MDSAEDIIVLEVIKLVTDSQVLIKTQKVVNLLFVKFKVKQFDILFLMRS